LRRFQKEDSHGEAVKVLSSKEMGNFSTHNGRAEAICFRKPGKT
jgi:hypothetical protein